ncbi:MAG: response regulator [Planctomycetota bacterium]|nr:response regulator [Planctomycetota bacterium]
MSQSARILICDDEPHIRLVVAARLRGAGHTVTEAADGAEALRCAELERPDLVITDFQMPEMSGLDLACALAERPALANVPVIMLTARGHAVDPERLARTRITTVLPKPFSARELLERAEALLRSPPAAIAA